MGSSMTRTGAQARVERALRVTGVQLLRVQRPLFSFEADRRTRHGSKPAIKDID